MNSQFANLPLQIGRDKVWERVHFAIKNEKPFSVIRYGEGEGRILGASKAEPLSMRVARRKVKKQTGQWISDGDLFELQKDILSSFLFADIIGIGAQKTWGEEYEQWYHVVVGKYLEMIPDVVREGQLISHPFVNYNILERVGEIACDAKTVTLITCRDLASNKAFASLASPLRHIQIPSQFIKRSHDGLHESLMHDVRIWPKIYRELIGIAERCSSGDLLLVGAGLFAKYVCAVAKQHGAVAVDMGSALDQLAGLKTRG